MSRANAKLRVPVTSFERMQYLDQSIKDIVKEFQKPNPGFLVKPLDKCTGTCEEYTNADNYCSPAMHPVDHRCSDIPPAVNSRFQYNEIFPHPKVRLSCLICKCQVPTTIPTNNLLHVFCSAMPYMPVCEICRSDVPE